LLQSFTGVVLQLETIHSLIDKQPAEARRMITDIEGLIMADQRELRSYVEQLRPRRRIEVPFDFQSRMDDLRSRSKSSGESESRSNPKHRSPSSPSLST